MSDFLNIYTVVPSKNIPSICKNGLCISLISESVGTDYICFTDNYSEIIALKKNRHQDIAVLSFNTKYLSELNKKYTLHRLDEHHFYTIEKIDPKYLTMENDYFLFNSLDKLSINESAFVQFRCIFEKYGVTENLDPVLYHIATTLNNNYLSHLSPYMHEVITTSLSDINGVRIVINSDEIPHTLSWFDFEKSEIVVEIRHFKDKSEYRKIRNVNPIPPSEIHADIDYESSLESGKIVGKLICILNEYSDGLYLGQYKIDNFNELIPWMRHEFNHLHKTVDDYVKQNVDDADFYINSIRNRTDNFTEDDSKRFKHVRNKINLNINYNNVVHLKDSTYQNDYLKKIAEILYTYGNWDERNANVEQYFSEHRLYPGNESSRQNLAKLKTFVNEFEPTYNDKVTIFDKFNKLFKPDRTYFKLAKDGTDKFEYFFDFLKRKLNDYIKLAEDGFDRIDTKKFESEEHHYHFADIQQINNL